MAAPSSTSKFVNFEPVFHQFDKDNNGKLSLAELQHCMRTTIGEEMSLQDAEVLVQSLDTDGDGLLDFHEFIKLLNMEEDEEKELKEAFGMYIVEDGGFITAKSLKRTLSRLGTSRDIEDCKAMISSFDLNGDGVLSFEEFKLMMML
ncbi:hypothetical protein J5N97_013759 [Dioscorea zingiberensis]|uniref:EF-hand domain-containing protein n=1 Tax=Dioscorea zingiberensis TaxID=325984 RepID=A0A9D5HIX4_9LILI|nr:hypothetical protein J5N97_013759 [Dioscorea zingiberensis]